MLLGHHFRCNQCKATKYDTTSAAEDEGGFNHQAHRQADLQSTDTLIDTETQATAPTQGCRVPNESSQLELQRLGREPLQSDA